MKQKMKTKKAAAKRFSITGTGKVKFKKAGLRHNTGLKATNSKRAMKHAGYMEKGDERLTKRCFPYGLS